eukprot:Nitzschia sp. Nitz4//scaffold30_size153850//136627//137382//NITZ4_002798-RA/size153850-processed-gene-0.24-mRNA-1//1//CDS//3329547324//895//frame0
MAPKKGGTNQKVAAANEKKAAAQAQKDAKQAAAEEAALAKEWSKGANNRGQARSDAAALKADEAARKRAEKAALLAEEESNLGSAGKGKKASTLSKKGKNKKQNDLSLLEGALVGAADKKMKAKKQEQRDREQKLKEAQAKKKEAEKPLDPLLANTNSMIGGTEDEMLGRAANRAAMEDNLASGIDGALQSLNVSSSGQPITSAKALYKAFEDIMLPQVKEDYPGLKLSQYKEKVFNLWKKAPENPANQVA